MILLLLLLLNCSFIGAKVAIFSQEELDVIDRLAKDGKGLQGKLDGLNKELKGLLQPSGQGKPSQENIDKVTNAIKKLKAINGKIITDNFKRTVTTDEFMDKNIIGIFKTVYVFLNDSTIDNAIALCAAPALCKQPFTQLTDSATKAENLKQLAAALASYTNNRFIESEILQKLIANLTNIPGMLSHLNSTIHNELKPDDAKIIACLADLPKDISLPINMSDVMSGKGAQEPGVSQQLHDVSRALRSARAAIAACQAYDDKMDENNKPQKMCTVGKIPFIFTLDEDYLKAFDNMVAKYNSRPKPTGETGKDPEPTETDPKPETTDPKPETTDPKPETTDPKPETTDPKPETDTNGTVIIPPTPKSPVAPTADNIKISCCQLCMMQPFPVAQPCQNNNQCNCGCSSSSSSCGNRGCRSQNRCCNSNGNNHCKESCCEKDSHDEKNSKARSDVILHAPEKKSSSSSSPVIALVSAISLVATLMR